MGMQSSKCEGPTFTRPKSESKKNKRKCYHWMGCKNEKRWIQNNRLWIHLLHRSNIQNRSTTPLKRRKVMKECGADQTRGTSPSMSRVMELRHGVVRCYIAVVLQPSHSFLLIVNQIQVRITLMHTSSLGLAFDHPRRDSIMQASKYLIRLYWIAMASPNRAKTQWREDEEHTGCGAACKNM